MLKKQDYCSSLEKRHREVCEAVGISCNLNKNLKDEFENVCLKNNLDKEY